MVTIDDPIILHQVQVDFYMARPRLLQTACRGTRNEVDVRFESRGMLCHAIFQRDIGQFTHLYIPVVNDGIMTYAEVPLHSEKARVHE